MKINRKAGSRNSWSEMDMESRQAVYLAERLVEGKKGVVLVGKRVGGCSLDVTYGHNLSTTYINIVDGNGYVMAFYSDGYFYDSLSSKPVELF